MYSGAGGVDGGERRVYDSRGMPVSNYDASSPPQSPLPSMDSNISSNQVVYAIPMCDDDEGGDGGGGGGGGGAVGPVLYRAIYEKKPAAGEETNA